MFRWCKTSESNFLLGSVDECAGIDPNRQPAIVQRRARLTGAADDEKIEEERVRGDQRSPNGSVRLLELPVSLPLPAGPGGGVRPMPRWPKMRSSSSCVERANARWLKLGMML